MLSFTWMNAFVCLFVYRYLRYIVNLISFWTFRPIPIPKNPTLTSQDVTVIIPSLEGRGPELERTIQTILENKPCRIILVTIEANVNAAREMVKTMPTKRIYICDVPNPNKRIQMVRAIPEVSTKITIFADDDVSWPPTALPWILAPFEKDIYGGVVTCQRLRRNSSPTLSQWVWGFLGALYLERRNFDCAATTHIDGGVPCLSGRTVAYRTKILQDDDFTRAFSTEEWLGRYRLNADDDNFITRWMVSHGWETYLQYHKEVEIQTTLEDNPKFLKQCLRWARSNWRSNLTSMLRERYIWRRQLYSTYAMHLTTLSPPAALGDLGLVFFYWKASQSWDVGTRWTWLYILLAWMFVSKFIKNMGHYIRYPVDFLLLPISIIFGYFHGIIKVHAMLSLNVTAWGSREGADTNITERERMRRLTESDRQEKDQVSFELFTQ